jgi:hypothetical protein
VSGSLTLGERTVDDEYEYDFAGNVFKSFFIEELIAYQDLLRGP